MRSDSSPRAVLRAEREPVEAGELQVEDEELVGLRPDPFQGPSPVVHGVHLEALALQVVGQELHDVGVVLHHERAPHAGRRQG
jgi:hypothetical protein